MMERADAKSRDDGGPAFPRPISEDRTNGDLPDGNDMIADQQGMTLRDYFAAAVAEGESAIAPPWNCDVTDDLLLKRCRLYYRIADAMLEARQKGAM